MKHLIDPMGLSLEELDHILNLAQDIIDHKDYVYIFQRIERYGY